jgi:outer membrane immunogenic protein
MKKKLLFTIAVISAINIHAQIQFGVKGGLNLSNLIQSSPVPEVAYNLKEGFNAGAFLNVPLSKHFGLQPEILYSGQGAKVNTNFENATSRLQYLSIPVLLRYNVSSSVFAEIGPQAGFLLSARKKVHSTNYVTENPGDPLVDQPGDNINIKSYYKSVDFSGVIGLGYHFTHRIGAAVAYKLSILNTLTSGSNPARHSVVQIDILYLFKKQN